MASGSEPRGVSGIEIGQPLPLLGGLSPAAFMQRHWQKKPLLVRQAMPGVLPPVSRRELFALSSQDEVESRLVQQRGAQWLLKRGPIPRRALPALVTPGWTLLVQGLDLHVQAAHELLQRFRFVPDARLDDLMLSYASDGGGVGAHLDAYDVFLLQVQGRRRWRIAPVTTAADAAFVPELPLKVLQRFAPTTQWLLEAGDMLYLPPGWAHEGTAEGGDCMTASIGFRAPGTHELLGELLPRLAEKLSDAHAAAGRYVRHRTDRSRFRDPRQPATQEPGLIPPALTQFALQALRRALNDEEAAAVVLGELLSEPKPQVFFDGDAAPLGGRAVRLDRRSRMMYDSRHVYLNGESFRAGGHDLRLMQQLADRRQLTSTQVKSLSPGAYRLVAEWVEAGWLMEEPAHG